MKHTITKDAWVKVTNEPTGSLFVQRGGRVALAELETLPTTSINDTEVHYIMKEGESKPYFNVPTGKAVYARALNKTAQLNNAPSEAS